METRITLNRASKARDSTITVYQEDDVEPIIEQNKRLQNDPQKSDLGRHIGTIPNVILMQWLNAEWARGNTSMKFMDEEFNKMVAKKLHDPEWAYLRTDGASNGFLGFGS